MNRQQALSQLRERYGDWALVTGASSGIGEQFARLLAAAGLNLIICARREDRLQTLAEQLQQQHDIAVEPLSIDLCEPNDIARLNQHCQQRELGLVVSNAGFGLKGEHHRQQSEQLSAMLAVNSQAPMLLAQALSPQMIARGRGGFIFTSSIEGFSPFPYSAAYAASKAFVLSLGQSLAAELKPHGIDVLTLAPGSTDTEALTLQGFNPQELSGLMSPSVVAEQALGQLGHNTVFISGAGNRLLIRLLCLLPRRWAVALAAKGMQAALKL